MARKRLARGERFVDGVDPVDEVVEIESGEAATLHVVPSFESLISMPQRAERVAQLVGGRPILARRASLRSTTIRSTAS